MANVRPSRIPSDWLRLNANITPRRPGEPERIPWVWYDTATYTSGTTTELDFFQSVQTDRVLGNMQGAGFIPSPMFFELHHVGFYFDLSLSVAAVAATIANTGAINDVTNLIEGTARFELAQKEAWRGKIGMLPPGYGVNGNVAITGTYTATDGDIAQQANNGKPDLRNRQYWWGELYIPPMQNFRWTCNWTSAVTLAAGNTTIVAYMQGYLYRRVL